MFVPSPELTDEGHGRLEPVCSRAASRQQPPRDNQHRWAGGLLVLGAMVLFAWASAMPRRSLRQAPAVVPSLEKVAPQLKAEVEPITVPSARSTGTSLLADSLLAALGTRAEMVAPQMSAENVASILDAYVKLEAVPSAPLMAALGSRAQQVVPEMTAANLALALDAYARLKQQPAPALWDVLDNRSQEVADDMGAQAVANTLHAWVVLGHEPDGPLRDALEHRAEQVAPAMGPEAVASTFAAAANMSLARDSLWAALGSRATAVASRMDAQDVANMLDAHSSMRKQPEKPLWTALRQRTSEVAPDMRVKDVTHTLQAYADAYKNLRRKPGHDLLAAIGERTKHVVDRMNAQDVTATLTSYAQLHKLEEKTSNGQANLDDKGAAVDLPEGVILSPQ